MQLASLQRRSAAAAQRSSGGARWLVLSWSNVRCVRGCSDLMPPAENTRGRTDGQTDGRSVDLGRTDGATQRRRFLRLLRNDDHDVDDGSGREWGWRGINRVAWRRGIFAASHLPLTPHLPQVKTIRSFNFLTIRHLLTWSRTSYLVVRSVMRRDE